MEQTFNRHTVIDTFHKLLRKLINEKKEITEVWFELSEINSEGDILTEVITFFVNQFDFIRIQPGNYTDYIVIDKISYILEALNFLEIDIKQLSELVDCHGFETLISEILRKNGFYVTQNFRFSDKSPFKRETKQNRYEIDVIGLSKKYLLVIDAKQWRNRDLYSSISKAADLQFQRVIALKKNPEIFSNLIQELIGFKQDVRKRLPLLLIPMMVTLEESFNRINDHSIPIVSIYKLGSFLREFELYLEVFKSIEIKSLNIQKPLF